MSHNVVNFGPQTSKIVNAGFCFFVSLRKERLLNANQSTLPHGREQIAHTNCRKILGSFLPNYSAPKTVCC